MTWNVVVGVVCTVLGALLSYLGFSRNKQKDDQKAGQQNGVMMTEIGYIKSGIDDIKAEQRAQQEFDRKQVERLVAVEQSAKQAHRRIDRLEGRET